MNPIQQKNMVQLNHLYLVVDEGTYQAIKEAGFIHSLAYTYEQKNKADGEEGWEGFYIRGKNTYIEFFYPQDRYPRVGISGIGLGVDREKDLETAYDMFKADHPAAQKGHFSRKGKAWFDYVTIKDGYYYDKHSFWIMAYAADCFSENKEDVSRSHYNKDMYNSDKPFLNITGFSIALEPKGLVLLESYLKSVGFSKNDQGYVTGEGVHIYLREEDETHQGIYEITFTLHPLPNPVMKLDLGSSQLKIDHDKATWSFFKNS